MFFRDRKYIKHRILICLCIFLSTDIKKSKIADLFEVTPSSLNLHIDKWEDYNKEDINFI